MIDKVLGAAVTAAGAAPDGDGYHEWLRRVAVIASDLARLVEAHVEREARKTGECYDDGSVVKPFRAKLVDVRVVDKGEGEHRVRRGLLVFDQRRLDGEPETIETPPLNSEIGADEFARARMLVGQQVRVWKRNFPHPHDPNKRLRELVAIDPAGGSPVEDTDGPTEHAGWVVDSLETLVAAAGEHLGMSPEQVAAAVERRFGRVPPGRRLPSRQYATLWDELAGGAAE